MKTARKHVTDALVFAAAAATAAVWIAGFFLVVVAELAKDAWR